ncbi:MAG: carboxypeptidase regulatory-like domain-containing protein [Acidobacteria bacterium]|nr:carboxypeptidase regulatory-like domain-containing protein [Acidobacteriota bacterium]
MRKLTSALRLAGLLVLGTLSTALLIAQSDRGSIRGTVEDATRAVISGARVTGTNVATGVQTFSVSTDSGGYNLPQLRPGVYRVEAERQGFKKLIRENVVVDVAGVIGLNLVLEVGAVTESITVEAAAPQLKTESTEVSTTVNPKTYMDLPLAVGSGRSPAAFVTLAPGTVSGTPFASTFSGGQILGAEVQVDGISTNYPPLTGDFRPVSSIPPDAIQEFNIATSNYSAEFGNTSGGVARFTIKSGTNDLHGNLYEYLRNDKLDSRGFFNRTRAINRRNEYGGSVGGPIWIPGAYDGRNRSFFFLNINQFKFRSGPNNALVSVPTAAFKRGDLSALRDNQGGLIQIYDPASTRADGSGGFARDPFPGNIIPDNRISSVSRRINAFLPNPNVGTGIVNNYVQDDKARTNRDAWTLKIDHKIGNHSIVGSYNALNPMEIGIATLPPIISSKTASRFTSQRTMRLAHDWVMTPTRVLHLAAGFNRQFDFARRVSYRPSPPWSEQLGLRGVGNGMFPTVRFAPFTNLSNNDGNIGLEQYVANGFIYSGSLSWVKGKHNIKFGAELRKYQVNTLVPTNTGVFEFNRNETAFPSGALRGTTGNAFASYLVGAVDFGQILISEISTGGRWSYMDAFIQDDFKVSRNLTVNLGLRWDFWLPMTEVNDVYSVMDPKVPNPAAGGRPGALIFAGQGPGRSGRHRLTNGISKNSFGPRLGFAWSVSPKSVVRSAYGVSYFATTPLGGGNVRRHAPGFEGIPLFQSPDAGLTPAFDWDRGFPQSFRRPPIIDPGFGVGGEVSLWNVDAHRPSYRQDWNFNVQRQLAAGWLIDVGYIGNKLTRTVSGMFNVNQVNPKFLSLGNLLLRPVTDPAVSALGFGLPYAGFSGTLAQALRPFPQYLEVGTVNGANVGIVTGSANVGNGTYHSLQTKLEKQFSKGLFLLVSHTYAKHITDASSQLGGFFTPSVRDHYNRRLEKAISQYNMPHRLTTAFTYELPIGPGKPVAGNVRGVAGKILGGWQISGIVTYQAGFPIVVGVANALPLFNRRNLPDVVAGANPKLDFAKFDPGRGDRMLNINAFRLPAPFTYGNAPSVLPNGRDFALYNEDFGIIKRTYLSEAGANVEFRFEMFNALNRVRFSAPANNVSDPFNFGRVFGQANPPRQAQFALRFNF